MKKEVLTQMVTLATGAFGLVAALAWNGAIQSLFLEGGVLHFLAAGGPFLYAILVTILAVIATMWISKIKPTS